MEAVLGSALATLAGALAGSFSLPMKKTTKWTWENTWLIWAIVALLIVPWAVALFTIPRLFCVLGDSGAGTLLLVFLFGAGWGLGALSFGRGISILGMSLAFAVSMGLTIVLGSLVPMFANLAVFKSRAGIIVAAGTVVMILGVIVCAIAGNEKEKKIKAATFGEKQIKINSRLFIKGMVFCVLGGIFSPMINAAFVFGVGILKAAIDAGAAQSSASDALWAVALSGGLVTNVLYCTLLLTRNKTWSNYRKPKTLNHWFLAMLMGVIWILSITCYGRAAFYMGTLGKSAGWAIYLGFCIFISNFLGIITGEWKDGRGKPIKIMYAGLTLLILATIVIGWGNSL